MPDDVLTGVSAGWHTHLGILAEVVAGRKPAPFWRTHTALVAEYDARLGETEREDEGTAHEHAELSASGVPHCASTRCRCDSGLRCPLLHVAVSDCEM